MAEENKDPKKFPPPLPGSGPAPSSFPGLPPFLPPDILQSAGAFPSLPGLPPLKNPASAGASAFPPSLSPSRATPPSGTPSGNADKESMEKKLSELEKKLQEEREKVLMSQLKNQQEAVTSARVESSLKELQDKIRRERRDQEGEESRLRLENKLREMEGRLAQERETWVATLKSQMQSRETQDKDVEGQFVSRIQEMERRWLDEKSQWQKVLSAKEEEVRNWKAVAEKLRGSESELAKALLEKKWNEERLREIEKKYAETESKYATTSTLAAEREKELIHLRAEVGVLKERSQRDEEQGRRLLGEVERFQRERDSIVEKITQEKNFEFRATKAATQREIDTLRAEINEREMGMGALRAEAKIRETKLLAQIEKYESTREAELQRLRLASMSEIKKHREQLEEVRRKMAEIETELREAKMAAQSSEKQASELRLQFASAQAQKISSMRREERLQAALAAVRNKWADREREIHEQAQARAMEVLEKEKAKLQMEFQRQMDARAAAVSGQTAQLLSIKEEMGALQKEVQEKLNQGDSHERKP